VVHPATHLITMPKNMDEKPKVIQAPYRSAIKMISDKN